MLQSFYNIFSKDDSFLRRSTCLRQRHEDLVFQFAITFRCSKICSNMKKYVVFLFEGTFLYKLVLREFRSGLIHVQRLIGLFIVRFSDQNQAQQSIKHFLLVSPLI